MDSVLGVFAVWPNKYEQLAGLHPAETLAKTDSIVRYVGNILRKGTFFDGRLAGGPCIDCPEGRDIKEATFEVRKFVRDKIGEN